MTNSENALFKLLDFTRSLSIISLIGMPVRVGARILDAAVVVQGGKIHAVVPKEEIEDCRTMLCGQTVNISTHTIIYAEETLLGITLGNDLSQPMSRCGWLCMNGAEIIFNLSATKELIGTDKGIRSKIAVTTSQCNCAYVLSSAGWGESTADSVYAGYAMIYEDGDLLAEGERFSRKEQLIICDVDIELLRHRRQEKSQRQGGEESVRKDPRHLLRLVVSRCGGVENGRPAAQSDGNEVNELNDRPEETDRADGRITEDMAGNRRVNDFRQPGHAERKARDEQERPKLPDAEGRHFARTSSNDSKQPSVSMSKP